MLNQHKCHLISDKNLQHRYVKITVSLAHLEIVSPPESKDNFIIQVDIKKDQNQRNPLAVNKVKRLMCWHVARVSSQHALHYPTLVTATWVWTHTPIKTVGLFGLLEKSAQATEQKQLYSCTCFFSSPCLLPDSSRSTSVFSHSQQIHSSCI